LPVASEVLEPLQAIYYDDMISYAAIWARTVESQVHREFVSWYDFSVWFKNSTSWNIQTAINAILSSQWKHSFVLVNNAWKACIKNTIWNKFSHIILRWWENWPNYDKEHVDFAIWQLKKLKLNPNIIIDLSHANSWKKAERQFDVLKNILDQKNKNIVWVMIESNINFWNQKFDPCEDDKNLLKYGVSITDECVNLQQTKEMLDYIEKKI
jgi:3-deoxy-7-phosphoheptulonate synthase